MDSKSQFGRQAQPGTLKGVTPPANFEFNARVTPTAARMDGYAVRIRSLSNIGVSFAVDAVADSELKLHEDVLLSLRLPGKTSPSTISCHVRHRSSAGDGFLYGCEYDWSATMDPLAVVEDLVGYMLDADD